MISRCSHWCCVRRCAQHLLFASAAAAAASQHCSHYWLLRLLFTPPPLHSLAQQSDTFSAECVRFRIPWNPRGLSWSRGAFWLAEQTSRWETEERNEKFALKRIMKKKLLTKEKKKVCQCQSHKGEKQKLWSNNNYTNRKMIFINYPVWESQGSFFFIL